MPPNDKPRIVIASLSEIPRLGKRLMELIKKGDGMTAEESREATQVKTEIEVILTANRDKLKTLIKEGVSTVLIDALGGLRMVVVDAEKAESFLNDVETDGKTTARAYARLFTTPWSDSWVHGPDTLMTVTAVTEKILQPGERLTNLKKISWLKPIANNLHLAAYAQRFEALPDRDRYSLVAEFLTSEGRTITVLGMEAPEDPVIMKANANPFADRAFLGFDDYYRLEDDSIHCFKIQPSPIDSCESKLQKSRPLAVATMAEILTLAGGKALSLMRKAERGDRLLGGLKDLDLPDDMGRLYGGDLRLKFMTDREHQGRSGMTLLPFRYQFPHQKNPSEGIMAFKK